MKTALMTMAVVLLAGCVGAGGFESQLVRRSGEAMYLHEARATERQPATLSVGAFAVEHGLPPVTTVRKTGGYAVPLLFVTLWKGEYQSALGAAQISNDYVQFMKDSLTEELKRSAKYGFVERDGDLEVDVRVTKIQMSAPIVESGNFLFLVLAWSYSKSVQAGPVEVAIEGEAVMRKGGQEVLRKPVLGRSRTGGLLKKYGDIDQLTRDFTTTMIEGFSLAVKDFNDNVVSEVNGL